MKFLIFHQRNFSFKASCMESEVFVILKVESNKDKEKEGIPPED